FLALRVEDLGGVGGVVGVHVGRIERHRRHFLVGIQVHHEVQGVGRPRRQVGVLQLQIAHHPDQQVAVVVHRVTLQTLAGSVDDEVVLVGAEYPGAGVADFTGQAAGDVETGTGDGQVEGTAGGHQRAVLADALGGTHHLDTHGLGVGVDAAELGTGRFEARGTGVGDVV